MDLADLKARRQAIDAEIQKAIANANMLIGHRDELDYWITVAEGASAPSAAEIEGDDDDQCNVTD